MSEHPSLLLRSFINPLNYSIHPPFFSSINSPLLFFPIPFPPSRASDQLRPCPALDACQHFPPLNLSLTFIYFLKFQCFGCPGAVTQRQRADLGCLGGEWRRILYCGMSCSVLWLSKPDFTPAGRPHNVSSKLTTGSLRQVSPVQSQKNSSEAMFVLPTCVPEPASLLPAMKPRCFTQAAELTAVKRIVVQGGIGLAAANTVLCFQEQQVHINEQL